MLYFQVEKVEKFFRIDFIIILSSDFFNTNYLYNNYVLLFTLEKCKNIKKYFTNIFLFK